SLPSAVGRVARGHALVDFGNGSALVRLALRPARRSGRSPRSALVDEPWVAIECRFEDPTGRGLAPRARREDLTGEIDARHGAVPLREIAHGSLGDERRR